MEIKNGPFQYKRDLSIMKSKETQQFIDMSESIKPLFVGLK